MMLGYHWNASEFPSPAFGSYEAINLSRSFCTDRYSRYGPYGAGEDENAGDIPFKKPSSVHWDKVDWGTLQQNCLQRNAGRYDNVRQDHKKMWGLHRGNDNTTTHTQPSNPRSAQSKLRSAVIMRTWIGMNFTSQDLQNIRATVMELSLFSGGEYEVFIMIDAQESGLPDISDEDGVKRLKESHLPPELHNMVVYFNDEILRDWYPQLENHKAILQYFQPMQIFAQLHQEFDFYWQLEMDARHTGHLYDFLERAAEFAKMQPRKYLWERNAHFYMPAVHGSWDNFMQRIDQHMRGQKSIWGPLPPHNITPDGPIPPFKDPVNDNYQWGVGEEADLITWLPHFDPEKTEWPFRNEVYNFEQGSNTTRRSSVVAMSRTSKDLLRVMHRDQISKGLGLVSEMSAVSWAMYYGLKAVQVPHPMYLDGIWNLAGLEKRVNSGNASHTSAGFRSIWSWGHHDDILYRMTYMFHTAFPEKLFRFWLGYEDDDGEGGPEWEKKNGRLCLPPMLLHPIKNFEREKTHDWL
jgi:hypothetical protein